VRLVKVVREQFGLRPALNGLDLPRSTWHYHQAYREEYTDKYGHLRGPLETIARKHPEYGYRRTVTELRETFGQFPNHKVVQRLHRQWGLPLIRRSRPPRPSGIRLAITEAGDRANLVACLSEILPLRVLYTDFTEIPFAAGKAFFVPILDHCTKLVLGWSVGQSATATLALEAWRSAKRSLRRLGGTLQGLLVHHDQDPAFTSYAWTGQLLLKDQVQVSYAIRGARDNPEMESFFSRFKAENHSLFVEAGSLPDLRLVLSQRVRYYNVQRRHSSLGNLAPMTYTKRLLSRKGPQ
jgi:putative transposase